MQVSSTSEFDEWFLEQELRIRAVVDIRVARIEEHNHLGNWRYLGANLAELKWKSGIRVYFVRIGDEEILLLLGGFKNAQKKDIAKAKKIFQRYAQA